MPSPRSHHEEHGVAVAQRSEEPAAETLARLGRQRREPVDLEGGVDDVLRLRHLREPVETVVGEGALAHHPFRRTDRVETGEGREQQFVLRTGETDEAEMLHGRSGY